MRKLKIYLETSVISYLDQLDAPKRMEVTRKLWERVKAGAFGVALSDVVFEELAKCTPKKRTILTGYLAQIQYERIEINTDIQRIANTMIGLEILNQKSYDDCRHIAAAIVNGCDAIVSWNFKHFVNHKTMQGVKAITALEGRSDILIYTPQALLGGESDDE